MTLRYLEQAPNIEEIEIEKKDMESKTGKYKECFFNMLN